MKRSNTIHVITGVFIILLMATTIFAEVPNTINYQGRIIDDAGDPIDGDKLMQFKIYDSDTDGTELWSSGYQVVQVNDGLFTYELGSNITLPEDLFTGDDPRYLGITVDTDAEQEPRIQFIAVPYARHAQVADSVSGDDFVLSTGDTISGHMYFDNDGFGKEAELLLYGGQSILNMYESETKRITLESEFATMILRQQDGDVSAYMSGGEDEEYDGGTIGLYDAHGSRQIYLNGAGTGDASVIIPDSAIHTEEIFNEIGIASHSQTNNILLSTSMTDIDTTSIDIPAPGYILILGKVMGKIDDVDGTGYGYIQIDEEEGGSLTSPYTAGFGLTNRSNGLYPDYHSVYCQRVYYKASAGHYFFRMEGMSGVINTAGMDVTVADPQMVALYIPTSYGAVSEAVTASDLMELGDITAKKITADREDQGSEDMYQVDLRELELRAKQKRIEALEAELELEKARRENK